MTAVDFELITTEIHKFSNYCKCLIPFWKLCLRGLVTSMVRLDSHSGFQIRFLCLLHCSICWEVIQIHCAGLHNILCVCSINDFVSTSSMFHEYWQLFLLCQYLLNSLGSSQGSMIEQCMLTPLFCVFVFIELNSANIIVFVMRPARNMNLPPSLVFANHGLHHM